MLGRSIWQMVSAARTDFAMWRSTRLMLVRLATAAAAVGLVGACALLAGWPGILSLVVVAAIGVAWIVGLVFLLRRLGGTEQSNASIFALWFGISVFALVVAGTYLDPGSPPLSLGRRIGIAAAIGIVFGLATIILSPLALGAVRRRRWGRRGVLGGGSSSSEDQTSE